MSKPGLAAILVIATCCLPAWALDSGGTYLVRGVGIETCAAYANARDNRRDAEYTAWLAGYISAFDRWTADVWDIEGNADFDGTLRWLDYFCRLHPQQNFAFAAENLIAFLYPSRRRNAQTAGEAPPRATTGSSQPQR